MKQQRYSGDDPSEGSNRPTKKSRIGLPSAKNTADERPGDSSSSSLCMRCASIDVTDLLKVAGRLSSPGGHSMRLLRLGTLDSPASRSCPCCQLFASVSNVCTPGGARKPQQLYAHPAPASEIWGRKGNVLLVASEDCEGDFDYHFETHGGISCTDPDPALGFVHAQSIHRDGVNFELLRRWIDSCDRYHEKCRRYYTSATRPKGMKLIDCDTREIVPGQSHKYVALSYVWGLAAIDPNHDDRVRDGKMPAVLHKTIEDAILATLKLGYQFLWIDRYCIDQESAEDKESQIGQMNLIYRSAEVTLIATAGTDPLFGLPGVSTTPRKQQPTVRLGDKELVSVFPRPEIAIQDSKWASRGWTYQEGYFSIRRLAFNEDQVSFSCYNGAAVEAISHLRRRDRLTYASEDKDDGDQDAYEILEHLTNYSGKQLTHGSDALNAVIGVFHDYGFKHGVTPHYLGVPIVRYSLFDLYRPEGQRRRVTEAFLIGLSWMNRKPGRRRNIWPSWTWAEWDVSFDYGTPSRDGRTHDSFTLGTDFVVKPRVWIETRQGYRMDLQSSSTLGTISRSQPNFGRFIHIESWTMTLEIRRVARTEKLSAQDDLGEPLSKRYSGFHARLKGEDVEFRTIFWPMDPDFKPPADFQTGTDASGSSEIVGVILSKLNLVQNRYQLIMMVVQKGPGGYFERIGYCDVISDDVRMLAKKSGPVEEDWVFGWTRFHKTTSRLCAKYMKRRTMRIG